MNRRDLALDARAIVLPAAIVVGASLASSAFAGLRADRDHWRAEAAKPRPTATRMTTAPPAVFPSPPPSSSSSSGLPSVGPTVVAVSQPRAPAGPPAAPRPTPAPSPTSPSPSSPCGSQSPALLHASACLFIGGK